MSDPKKNIFISYAQVDRDYADAFVESLKLAGSSVWHDKEIRAGDDWDSEIQNALRSASVVVLVVSQAALSSQWVNYEIGSAMSAGIPVIPVLVGEVASLPSHLRHIHAVDARGLDSAAIGAKVATALEGLKDMDDDS